ncbi:MAG: hypothetical protein RIS43_90 [Actinomycetota bacterium]
MPAVRHLPLRTCVGCRKRAALTDLIRLVVVDGVVTVDRDRKVSGRGAHLHPDLSCAEQAIARKSFQRSFRAAVSTHGLIESLSNQEMSTIHRANNGA